MKKLTSRLDGDAVIFKIEIPPQDKQDWCITVASQSNYAGGFELPAVFHILEYQFKVEKFCGTGSQEIKRRYLLPAKYLAVLEKGGKEQRSTGPHITRFEITGMSITDKDVTSAKELLGCIAETYTKNKQKEETLFENMMLNPFLDSLIVLLENVVNKRDISPYVDNVKNNIVLFGPIIKEGKYFWPIMHEGKYIPYR